MAEGNSPAFRLCAVRFRLTTGVDNVAQQRLDHQNNNKISPSELPSGLHPFILPSIQVDLPGPWKNPHSLAQQMQNAQRYAQAYAVCDARIFAFDLDGTLINGHADPLKAGFTPEVVEALRELVKDPRNQMVFITARPLDWVLERMKAAGLDDARISVMAGAGRNNAFAKDLGRFVKDTGDYVNAGTTIGFNGSQRYLLQHKAMQEGQETLESFLQAFRDEYVRLLRVKDGGRCSDHLRITHGEGVVEAQITVSKKSTNNSQRRKLRKLQNKTGQALDMQSQEGYWPFLRNDTEGIDFSQPGEHDVCVRFEIKEGLMTINFSPRGSGDSELLYQVAENLDGTLKELGLRVEGNHEVMTIDALPATVEKGQALIRIAELVARAKGAKNVLLHTHGDSFNDIGMMQAARAMAINGGRCRAFSANTLVARTKQYAWSAHPSKPLNPNALLETANFILPNPDTLAQYLHALAHTYREPASHQAHGDHRRGFHAITAPTTRNPWHSGGSTCPPARPGENRQGAHLSPSGRGVAV